jgi:hypothetical protein
VAASIPATTGPALVRRVVGENSVIFAVMVAYIAAALVVASVYRFPITLTLYAPFWAVMACGAGLYALARPLAPSAWRLGERLAMAAPVLILSPAFFSAFTSLKTALPLIHPYAWDSRLAAADAWIFGAEAWRSLQPLLGHPPVTFALSALYSLWHLLLISVFGLITLSLGRSRLRRQALTALMLSWAVLGTLGAIVFSSVGPCFSALLDPNLADTFADQAAYLEATDRTLPIFEFAEQKRLLSAFRQGQPALGSGISAMPSMHVAVALIMALAGWRTTRWAGMAATAYLVVVIVASIHLGWHYAWDDAAALLGAGLVWALSGWIIGRRERRVALRPAPA